MADTLVQTSLEYPGAADPVVRSCLDSLQALGRSFQVRFSAPNTREPGVDARLELRLHRESVKFLVIVTRTHLSYANASGFIQTAQRRSEPWVLFAPYVPPGIAADLVAHELSYVDAVGNCHLEVRGRLGLIAHVEGKKPLALREGVGGARVPAYQLMFALLASPRLLERTVRDIATAAGVGKSTVSGQLRRLEEQGLIDRKHAAITRRRELLDRWLSAYADTVRSAWRIGRYRTQTTEPDALEHQIEQARRNETWAFGGGAAAWRMKPYYRGHDTILHVQTMPADALRRLRAIPHEHGPLTILQTPGTVAYDGKLPHLAHPLLIYTEMVSSADPRLREAANEMREALLESEP